MCECVCQDVQLHMYVCVGFRMFHILSHYKVVRVCVRPRDLSSAGVGFSRQCAVKVEPFECFNFPILIHYQKKHKVRQLSEEIKLYYQEKITNSCCGPNMVVIYFELLISNFKGRGHFYVCLNYPCNEMYLSL